MRATEQGLIVCYLHHTHLYEGHLLVYVLCVMPSGHAMHAWLVMDHCTQAKESSYYLKWLSLGLISWHLAILCIHNSILCRLKVLFVVLISLLPHTDGHVHYML